MSFPAKTDPWGIADSSTIVAVEDNENRSASVVEAQGADGSIVATEVFAQKVAPAINYVVKADVSWAAAAKSIGTVHTVDTSHKAVLLDVTITTAAGAAPTISASGEQVQDSASAGCLYNIPAVALSAKHHAQTLFSAFTLEGTGCHLNGATYHIFAALSTATKDGETVAFDIHSGKIEVTVNIKQTGSTAPTLTAGSGFTITSPLNKTNPDADYPTYTATLTQNLAKATATVSNNNA